MGLLKGGGGGEGGWGKGVGKARGVLGRGEKKMDMRERQAGLFEIYIV